MASIYYEDKYQKEITSKVFSIYDENGKNCIQIQDTIFYPQGGGQKGDRGTLCIGNNNYEVINTVKDIYSDDSVLIVEPEIPMSLLNSEVKATLDWNFRYRQMRLHTCVHLHHCCLEKILGKKLDNPITSAIEDGFAFNKYEKDCFDLSKVDEANELFLSTINNDIPVYTYPDSEKEGYRWWECMGYKIPCGGLHVNNLNEIGNIKITISSKKGKMTIKFTLVE